MHHHHHAFACHASAALRVLFLFVGSCLLLGRPLPARAADYNVTLPTWGTASDVGSFAWAVEQANTNPGTDTIRVQAGLQIDVDVGSTLADWPTWVTRFTDSVVVEGNNARLVANPTYVTSGGQVATKTNIVGSAYSDPIKGTDVVTTPGVSFAQVGTYQQDNTGIGVTFRNLNADGLGSLVLVNENATLNVVGGNFNNIVNYTGVNGRSAFSARAGSTMNLNGISLNRNFPFGDFFAVDNYAIFSGSIDGMDATLNLQNSTVTGSYGAGAIAWNGGTANVVSSIIANSGGLQIEDGTLEGVLNVTNSIVNFNGGETLQQTNRIIAGVGGVANVTASTILYNSLFTTGHADPFNNNGMPLTAAIGGTLNVQSSAVIPLNWDEFYAGHQTYAEMTGGNLTADDFSYIAATASQDRAALQSLFGNSNFLTEGETVSIIDFSGTDLFEDLPYGAVPLSTGVLIDAVPNAGTGGVNELINPIDGLPLLYDVYGNARTNGLGFRNIGAVQAVPEPSTLVSLAGGACVAAILAWRRRRARAA